MKLSLIMMAKNVEKFVGVAIARLQDERAVDWELIIVDDHSTDGTRQIIDAYARDDERIQAYTNPGSGKVDGTSFGYSKSSGDVIKCIDSDDVLLPEFFNFFQNHKNHDVLLHSSFIVDEDLNHITTYHPDLAWFHLDYSQVLERLISFPKFSWSFSREIGEKIFPLPSKLPFEDVWMSLLIKKHARCPRCVREPVYLYRQHATQTFGGILNFSREAVRFRAQRLLRLIEVLENEPRAVEGIGAGVFTRARRENRFLLGEIGPGNLIFDAELRAAAHKLILKRYFPRTAQIASKLKWGLVALK